jgi:glucose/arabinose dehydrogenase
VSGTVLRVKRAVSLTASSLLLLMLPPLGGAPASAAVKRAAVVKCRVSNRPCWPTAFAFTPNGASIFYVERFTGQIRLFDRSSKKDRVWARLRGVASGSEQGLLGLAVDPGWPTEGWVYVYYTAREPLQNRIIRLRKRGDGSLQRRRLTSIPAASVHNGGPIHFGPDGMLYAVTGDALSPSASQDAATNSGKMLRMTKTGGVPPGNPFPGSRAFSIGHRNSFGFAFDPRSGRLWQTENGPECNDEVNLVASGRNYGWGGSSDCPDTSRSGTNPVAPRLTINPSVAPTGAAFCDDCGLGAKTKGALLFGSFNDRAIRRLRLTANRQGVLSQTLFYRNASGILAVEAAPDGRIFFSDENGIYRLTRS